MINNQYQGKALRKIFFSQSVFSISTHVCPPSALPQSLPERPCASCFRTSRYWITDMLITLCLLCCPTEKLLFNSMALPLMKYQDFHVLQVKPVLFPWNKWTVLCRIVKQYAGETGCFPDVNLICVVQFKSKTSQKQSESSSLALVSLGLTGKRKVRCLYRHLGLTQFQINTEKYSSPVSCSAPGWKAA